MPKNSGIITKYMPIVRNWALGFLSAKSGHRIDDEEDYIQAAYVGLIKYIAENGGVDDNDVGLLRLYVKHELLETAWQSLQLAIPRNLFIKSYLDIENSVDSLDALFASLGDKLVEPTSLWPYGSQITIDERIDLQDAICRMSPSSQLIYDRLLKGETISEVCENIGGKYTTVYDQISRIRRYLKVKAPLGFLIHSYNVTEESVTCYA